MNILLRVLFVLLAQKPRKSIRFCTTLPDGNSDVVPPDPIPNSEVKRVSGDGSVGFPHVRVAHRQAPNLKEARSFERAFCVYNLTP